MTELELDDASDLWDCLAALSPTERPRLLPWAEENIVTDLGRPYDHDAFPHIGSPGGPMDAFDFYGVREIVLQWASRLGKTFFGQCCTIYNGVQLRLPQMFASSKEGLALQVVSRTYKMIRHVPRLSRALVKPERMQQQHLIEFWGCSVFVGWARSAATLADKDALRGHGNEADDWDHLTTAKDGDPLNQFLERFKNHWGERKIVVESIPKIRGKSRVEARRKEGWDCEFQVPCPHCKKYQALEFGTADTDHGIKWESKDGKILKAWYQCIWCQGHIENHHREDMMRRGVWVPAGCKVNHEAAYQVDVRSPDYRFEGWDSAVWIETKPLNDGEIASYRLSSYVALAVTWNDCAKAFLDCKGHPQKLRNFKNQWDGHTWEIRKSRSDPSEIVKRIATDYPKGVVPEWADFLALGVDRQQSDGGFVVWRLLACTDDDTEMHHVVDFGFNETLDEMWKEIGERPYYKPDSSDAMYIEVGAIDSGWNPKATYEFCQEHEICTPSKGGNTANEVESYKWTDLDDSKYDTEGLSLLLVATYFTETGLQHRLDTTVYEQPGSFSVCSDAAKDDDFITDLVNATLADKTDAKGDPVRLWVKRFEATPNDGRDAIRYGIEAGNAYRDEGGPIGNRTEATARVAIERRPDGRNWTD